MQLKTFSVLVCSSLLSVSALAAGQDAADTEVTAPLQCAPPTTQTITDAATRLVLQALVEPSRVSNRTSLFEQYLASPVTAPNSARQVATSHARLALAAEHMQAGQYALARQVLSGIDLSSTVAVDAALLLAESWRLEGNSGQSQAWLLRVVQRYSSDPKALEGLLLSARDMAQAGQVREAWALYNLINAKVLDNVEQVTRLRTDQDNLVQQLLETRLDASRDVNTQIIKHILHSDAQSALANMRDIIEARQQLACLARQDNALKDDAWDESIMTANVTSFQTMLETEGKLNQRQLEALKAELARAEDYEKPDIEAEINELEEHIASLQQRLEQLAAQQASLPVASVSRKKQLQQRIQATEQRINQNQQAIRDELDVAIGALQTRYRELAAETQLARAELMQLVANR